MALHVVWNGARHHPGGPYLFAETELVHASAQRPFRSIRDLSDDEVASILTSARFERHQAIARRFKVSAATVDHLVMAAKSEHLVKG